MEHACIKKALLIGINYLNTSKELAGCINDMLNIKCKLISDYKFLESDITVMTDNTNIQPTKINILNTLKNILLKLEANDILFFAFSGHGSNILNDDGTEIMISKDLVGIFGCELKTLIEQYLKKNTTIFLLFDSCHNGTLLNLKYEYLNSSVLNFNIINKHIDETIGNVILISGCTNNQTGVEALINNIPQGAMTWSFLEAITKKPNLSWKDLIFSMRKLLKDVGYTQTPHLFCGKSMNLSSKFIL